jgi:hypothetical protein
MSRLLIRSLSLGQAPLALALLLAGSMPGVVLAQQSVAATQRLVPTKDPNGPKLPVTIKFIEDKVNQQGIVNVAGYIHDNATGKDWIWRQSFEQTHLGIDRKQCRLSYHKKVTSNGTAMSDGDRTVLLRYVTGIDILPKEQAWKLNDAKAGNTTWTYKADPSVTVLRLEVTDGAEYELEFYDNDVANRVAKALIHAIDLCGGKDDVF